MMGVSHAVSGCAAGALLLPVLTPGAPVAEKIALIVVSGGWALWPDVDQGGVAGGRVWGSTAARTWGPVTAVIAAGVGRIAGGHRNGTHSLLGVAVFTGIAALATLHPVSTMILVALSVGLALRGASWLLPRRPLLPKRVAGMPMHPRRRRANDWVVNLILSATVAGILVYGPPWGAAVGVGFGWLPVAVAAGCAVHILGDMLTPEGCPLFWPVWRRRFGVGLFTTATPVEAWIVVPALAAVMVWAMHHDGMLTPVVARLQTLVGWGEVTVVVLLAALAGVAAHREHAKATSR